jgi:hypothetical protein
VKDERYTLKEAFEDRHKLEHLMLMQMQAMANEGIIPHWDNYKLHRLWRSMEADLTAEERWHYRQVWIALYKDTCPSPHAG